MEEILKVLTKIQKELDDQKVMIRQNGQEVADQVTQNVNKILEEKFFVWEKKYETLKEKVDKQEKRLYHIDKQARKRNIIFFGIEEEGSAYEDMENYIIEWIEKYFSIKLERRDIQELRRIGKKGEKPRPLIVTFTTLGLKINILKQKRVLKDTQYYINEDYPQYILEKRKDLQQQLLIEKQKGNNAKIIYDKLIVKPASSKRVLSTSPEANPQEQREKNMQATKKSKTNRPQTLPQRSNSLSETVLKPSMLHFLVKNSDKTTSNQEYNTNK